MSEKEFEQYMEWLEEIECEEDDEDYVPSASNGDYSPTHPWDAPGMSIHDFI